MASLFNKIAKYARSPEGQRRIRQASQKAQEIAKDPATKRKLEDVRSRLNKRGTRG